MLLGEVITRSIHRAPCAEHSRCPINDNRKNELWREKESRLHGGWGQNLQTSKFALSQDIWEIHASSQA